MVPRQDTENLGNIITRSRLRGTCTREERLHWSGR